MLNGQMISPSPLWLARRAHRMEYSLRCAAIAAGRLHNTHLNPHEARQRSCPECCDLLWQYPEPEYWMQYPLSEFPNVDGKLYCSEQCAEAALRRGEQLNLF